MTLEMIQLEIQKRQGDILSLRTKISSYDEEHTEMWELRAFDLCRLISERRAEALQRINFLETEIEELMTKARQLSKENEEKRAVSPLELLGISALMKADGRISDEQYNAILREVRRSTGIE
jgi:hypothetical protein